MKLFKVTLITYDDSQKTEFYMIPKPDEYDENKMPVFQEKRLLESTEFKSFTQKAESPLITVKYDICEINDSYVQGGYNYERIQALESDNKINIIGGNEYSVQMDKLNRKKSSSADKKKFVPVAIASFFVLMLAVLVIFGLNKKKIPISEENAPESQISEQSSATEMSAGVSDIQTSAITESTITSETVFTSSEENIASSAVSAFEDEPVPAEDIIVKSDGTDVWVEYPPERDNDDSAADTVGGNSSTSSQAQTGKGTYKITFNANGGEGNVSPMSITAGFNVILPQEGVTRDGYDFVGWSLTAEKQYPLYDYSMPDNDVILYAIWQPKEYTVTYDSNGGLGLVVPHNVKVGDEVPLPLEGLENGEYTLVGWNTNKNSRSALKKYFMPDEDVTLYAVWSEKAQAKITLMADGQESSFVCNIGDELNCRDDFGVIKDGYIVSGWTLYDGYGDILQTMTVRGDTTLYATWEEATYINITIDCSYLNEEPKIVKAALDMNGHAKVELPVVDTAKNHKFGYTYGWSTSKNGTLKYYGGEIAEFDKPSTVYRVRSIYYGGDGTKEQPYLINSWEHIKLMSEKGVKGYYRQIADIQLPDSYAHNSINVIPLEKSLEKLEDFYFSYDGGGYSIFNLHGIGGLFGNVTRSVIKNVVLDGVNICVNDAENAKIGNIVNNVEAGTYSAGGKEYAAGNSSIKNCAVLNSTITISGGTVDYIGGAIGYGGSVCDTYINLCSIYVEANASVNNIGGIAGRAAEISSSYVVGLNVEGKIIEGGYNIKNLGGVVATGLGISIERTNHSYRYEGCNVIDTAVRNAVFNNAENIGGIISVAEGNNGSPYITRCYIANGVMNGGTVGSIVGCDGSSAMRYTVSYVVVDDTNAYPNIGRCSENAVSQTVFGAQILRVPYDGLKIDGISYVLGENWICDSNCNDGFAFPSKIKKFLQK